MAEFKSDKTRLNFTYKEQTRRGSRSKSTFLEVQTTFNDETGETVVTSTKTGNVLARKSKTGDFELTQDGKDIPNFEGAFANDQNVKAQMSNLTRQGITKTLKEQGKSAGAGNAGNINSVEDLGNENPPKEEADQPEEKAGPTPTNNSATASGQLGGEASYRKSYGNLYYPEDLPDSGMDVLRFVMYRHVANSKLNITGGSGEASLSSFFDLGRVTERFRGKKTLGSVMVPIQGSINSSDSVSWGPNELNAFQAYGASALSAIMGSGLDVGKQLGASLNQLGRDVTGNSEELSQSLTSAIASRIVGGGRILTRATGAVVNPNMELLFNGPSLRNFTFQIRLSPRNAKETQMCKKIIRFFKQGMSVKATSKQLFLQTPNVFQISYGRKGTEVTVDNVNENHEFMNCFKMCALTSCSVDYNPDGSFMTLPDGSMTAYNISMTFSELEPIYDSDYSALDSDQDTMIGY